ncbi:hypothetical protein LPJ81_005196, partial [Coemansia sp. IMI 209127]
MTKFQEPIRGIGFRRMLRRMGFEVYLIDEYLTSSICPTCLKKSLTKFKVVPNPRFYRRADTATVLCHGLLMCTTDSCKVDGWVTNKDGTKHWGKCYRLWNRDLVGVLNMRHILNSLCLDGTIPLCFS